MIITNNTTGPNLDQKRLNILLNAFETVLLDLDAEHYEGVYVAITIITQVIDDLENEDERKEIREYVADCILRGVGGRS